MHIKLNRGKGKKIVLVYFFEEFNKYLRENTLNELKEAFDSVAFEGTMLFLDRAYYAPNV